MWLRAALALALLLPITAAEARIPKELLAAWAGATKIPNPTIIGTVAINAVQCNSGSAGTTCAVSPTVASGDLLVVAFEGCSANDCGSGTGPTISSIAGDAGYITGCAGFTNAASAATGEGTDIWHCLITKTGTPTITVTVPSSWYQWVLAYDIHGALPPYDDGIGNNSNNNSTTMSISGNGNTAHVNDLCIISSFNANGNGMSTPSGWAVSSAVAGSVQVNQSFAASGSSVSATSTLSSSPWTASLACVL